MSNNEWLKQQLDKYGAVITNSHVVLTSKRHSDGYINLRVLEGHTNVLLKIGGMIASVIYDHERDINLDQPENDSERRIVIVGPETLGRTLATFTAFAGSFEHFAWCVMEKTEYGSDIANWNPKLNLQEIVKGSRCYIIDDLLTTAKSVKLTQQLIERTGGEVEGIVVVVRRDQNVTAEAAEAPWLHALLDVSGLESWEATETEPCPKCKEKRPMRRFPGHGGPWLKEHPDYPEYKE